MTQPTDQNSKLHDALAGPYSRRCVEPCVDCDESGVMSAMPHVPLHVVNEGVLPCSTCSGHGLVFREDEAGRELIRHALRDRMSVYHSGKDTLSVNFKRDDGTWVGHSMIPAQNKDRPGLFDDLWAWDNRHNQPWQSAIEQHVRDYIAPAPDLRINTEELKRLLREAAHCWAVHFYWDSHGGYFASVDEHRTGIRHRADTEGIALFNAACAALLGGE